MKVFRYLVLTLTTMLAAAGVHAQHPIHPAVRWAKMGAGSPTVETHSITFSPDGSLFGNSTAEGYMFTETATGAIRAILPGIYDAAFSPDGKLVACAGGRITSGVILLDGDTFQPVDTLERDISLMPVDFVEFSPDGTRLLIGSTSFLSLWDMQTRKKINPGFQGFYNVPRYQDFGFSSDGSKVVALQANQIVVYSAKNAALLDTFFIPYPTGTRTYPAGIRCSPDGNSILIATLPRQTEPPLLMVWNYRERRVERTFPLPIEGNPQSYFAAADITVTPDGRYAAVSIGRDSSLRFIDLETGVPTEPVYFRRPIYTALFSPDGRYLAVAGHGLHIHLLDGVTRSYLRDIPIGQEGYGQSLALSPDGRLVASYSRGAVPGVYNSRHVRVWDVATGALKQMLVDLKSHDLPLSFTPDGAGVMVPLRCGTSSAAIYSVESGEFLRDFPCDPDNMRDNGQRTLVAPHPDGRHVLVFGSDEWKPVDVETMLPAPGGEHRGIGVMAMSSDGRRLATWGLDTLIRLWDLESRAETGSIPALLGWADTSNLLALTPNGSHLLMTIDHRFRAHEIATGREWALAGNQGSIEAIAVSPDGTWAFATGNQGAIYVWRLSTGELVYTYSTAESGVHYSWAQLVIAPDFSSFTTLGSRGTVVNWSTDSIRSLPVSGVREALPENVPAVMELAAYPNPASAGAEIRFNPAGSFTGALRVYDASGRTIATLAEGTFEPGEQSYRWDDRVAPGLYIIGIQTGGEIVARTLLCVE